jgi:hypothetical protein
MSQQAAVPTPIAGVVFYHFQHQPTGRSAGYVGVHPDGRVFVSAKIYPSGMHDAVLDAAADGQAAVWHDHPNDLIPYLDAEWLKKAIKKIDPSYYKLPAIDAMVSAVLMAKDGGTNLMI